MKIIAKAFPFPLAFAARTNARSFLRFTLLRPTWAPLPPPSRSVSFSKPSATVAGITSSPGLASIYAVDDLPRLTELYSDLLEPAGYDIKTFNDRRKALAALSADGNKPALLITNYIGFSMPINQFIQACRFIHPGLRILMASGFSGSEMRFSQTTPDRFIQKPFTAEEFLQAVKATLDAK